MFLSEGIKYFQTLTPNFHPEIFYLTKKIRKRQKKKQCDFRAQTQGQSSSRRTPTLTATSSFSNVPLKQIWSKASIIFVGTTYKRAEQQSETYEDGAPSSGVLCDTQRYVSPRLFRWWCILWSPCRRWAAQHSGGRWWLSAGLPRTPSPMQLCSRWTNSHHTSTGTESLKTSLSLQLCVHVAVCACCWRL